MQSLAVNKIISVLGLVVALSLTACAPASQSKSSSINNNNLGQSSCNSSPGVIYNETQDGVAPYSSRSFQDRVGDFVSATLTPSDLGTVSGSKTSRKNYISISGKAKFAADGSLVPTQSNLSILIYDSYVGTLDVDGTKITAYPVTINSAVSGQMSSANNTFMITYQDGYGSVTLNGKINGTDITGRVDFSNTRSADSSTPRSGVLGAFNISTCSLL